MPRRERDTTRRSPDFRCAYCGKEMKKDFRVGGELCCRACEEFMREKKIYDVLAEKEK